MANEPTFDLNRPTDIGLLEITATGKDGLSASGFEGAHLFGKKFWDKNLGFLDDLNEFGIGRDSSSNGALQPDNQRAGATLQVAVHRGQQTPAFDALQFDAVNDDSHNFLNTIKQNLKLAKIDYADNPAELLKARRAIAREVYIYQRIQEISAIHGDVLARAGYDDTVSLAFNENDPRSGTDAFGRDADGNTRNVRQYLESEQVRNSQKYGTMKGTKLWAYFEKIVPKDDFSVANAAQDFAIRDQVLNDIPDYSRTYFPNGEPKMNARVLGEVESNDSIMKNVLGKDGVVDGQKLDRLKRSQAFKEIQAANIALVEQEVATTGRKAPRNLFGTQQNHVRTFGKKSNLAVLQKLNSANARFIAENIDDFPENLKGAAKNLLSLMTKGLESPYAGRIALSAGGGLLALADMWVEADRRGGFTSPELR
jgi:hypothetical protein